MCHQKNSFIYFQDRFFQNTIGVKKTHVEDIKNDYLLLIESVQNSSDEWLRRKAFEFCEYPTIENDQDINESVDISAFIDNECKNQGKNNDVAHFDVSRIEKLIPDMTRWIWKNEKLKEQEIFL